MTQESTRTAAPPPPPARATDTRVMEPVHEDPRLASATEAGSAPARLAAARQALGLDAGPQPVPPAPGTRPTAPVATGQGALKATAPRRVRLSIARVDPWSVMKLAFLLAVALGIMMVAGAALVWIVLDTMQVFANISDLLTQIGSQQLLGLMEYVRFDRVMSMATIIAVVDVVLLTVLATLLAFIYNIVAALVGGLHMTLTDD